MHTGFRMFSVIWKISNAFCNLVVFCFVDSRNKSHTETWRGFCCYNFHSWCNACPSSNFEDSEPGIGQMLINCTFTMNVLGSLEKVGMMGICPNLYHQLLSVLYIHFGWKKQKTYIWYVVLLVVPNCPKSFVSMYLIHHHLGGTKDTLKCDINVYYSFFFLDFYYHLLHSQRTYV